MLKQEIPFWCPLGTGKYWLVLGRTQMQLRDATCAQSKISLSYANRAQAPQIKGMNWRVLCASMQASSI